MTTAAILAGASFAIGLILTIWAAQDHHYELLIVVAFVWVFCLMCVMAILNPGAV